MYRQRPVDQGGDLNSKQCHTGSDCSTNVKQKQCDIAINGVPAAIVQHNSRLFPSRILSQLNALDLQSQYINSEFLCQR